MNSIKWKGSLRVLFIHLKVEESLTFLYLVVIEVIKIFKKNFLDLQASTSDYGVIKRLEK